MSGCGCVLVFLQGICFFFGDLLVPLFVPVDQRKSWEGVLIMLVIFLCCTSFLVRYIYCLFVFSESCFYFWRLFLCVPDWFPVFFFN